MENQIEQQYLDLDADRTSTHWMASNQLRLWFSAFALLLCETAHFELAGHRLAAVGTIRQRLLDRRHGYGQHPPGLHSARFGISASVASIIRLGTLRHAASSAEPD
jgi:Transposase DDE domain group 1